MDCREFQQIVVDLARGESAADGFAQRARSHAGECKSCAARLAAEEKLAANFATLRDQDAALQPPPGLEALLLEELAKSNASRPLPKPVLRARWGWWVAAAAAIAIALWLSPWRQEPVQHTTATDAPTAGAASEAADSKVSTSAQGTAAANPPAEPAEVKTPAAKTGADADTSPNERSAEARQPSNGQREPATAPSSAGPQPQLAAAADLPAEPAQPVELPGSTEREVVTDFVPLTSADWASPTSRARLVRVRLPSTALLYFGLPAGGGTATVEADVVLGEDGLAHAVRFVRPVLVSASSNMPVSGTNQRR